MLAQRLSKQGLALSGGALAAVLSQGSASAAVPPLLLASTVQAGTLMAAGPAAAVGVVSAQVAALAEGIVKTLSLTKLTTLTTLLLATTLLGTSAGLITDRLLAAEQPREARENAPAPFSAATTPQESDGDRLLAAEQPREAREDAPAPFSAATTPQESDRNDAAKRVWQKLMHLAEVRKPSDRELLQGTWVAVFCEREGKKDSDPSIKNTKYIFAGDQLRYSWGIAKKVSAYRLITDRNPKEMDLGFNEHQPMLAIYELDGKRLKICFRKPGGNRPTGFDTSKDKFAILYILEQEE
jgi:uncharacterized protein (TIGR03067 family)